LHSFDPGQIYDKLDTLIGERLTVDGMPIIRSKGTESGFLIFGPYVDCPAGEYEAFLFVRGDTAPIGENEILFAIDVAREGAPMPIRREFTATAVHAEDFLLFSLPFTLDRPSQSVEVRLRLVQPAVVDVIAQIVLRKSKFSASENSSKA
jgi:hypothetical protein